MLHKLILEMEKREKFEKFFAPLVIQFLVTRLQTQTRFSTY